MKIKRTLAETCFNIFNILLLTAVALCTLYPLWHVFFASFSDPALLAKHTGAILRPLGLSFDAYKAVFAKTEIWIGYGNTIFYLVVGTAVNMIVTVPMAYMLSKGNELIMPKYIMMGIVFTMYFSGGLIPLYLIVKGLHLTDTRWAVIFPTALSTFNLIIMRTAFVSLPKELEEAARIDGAGILIILVKVVLPLVKSTMAVIVLYYAVAQWNQWFQAMIYLRNQSMYPLQLFLRDILIENESNDMMVGVTTGNQQSLYEAIKYATIVIATLPILLLYPFLQKYFVQGVMIGAVKG